MDMRAWKYIPTLLLFASALWAADPFIGDWKLNVSKSDFGSGPKAESGSASFKADGDGYLYQSETDYGGGNVGRLGAPLHFDGKPLEGSLDGRALTFVPKRIDANTFEVIFTDKETGKVFQSFRYAVSPKDGTLTFLSQKTGAEKPDFKQVYEKQ